jgi:hypothetical protein
MMLHLAGFGALCQSQRCKYDSGEPDAKLLQRAAAGDGLSHSFGQFIEFVVHNFPFALVCSCLTAGCCGSRLVLFIRVHPRNPWSSFAFTHLLPEIDFGITRKMKFLAY